MKRIVSIVCAALLCVGMVMAEGSKEAAKPTSGPAFSAPGVLPIVKAPVTLRVMVPQKLSGTPDWATNKATVKVEEVTGVKFQFDVAPDFNQARSLAIASGDLPDIFMGATIPPSDIMKNGPKGIYIPLNDLIEKHGPNIKKAFLDDPSLKRAQTTPDGNMYGLAQVNDDLHGIYGQKVWINKSFLDKLGLKVPTTTDEFYNVLKAFKTKDPNGNGKADEIPYCASANGWLGQVPGALLYSFLYVQMTTGGISLKNGKVDFAYTKPEYREALRYHNKLYAEGLIDPASFTQTEADLRKMGENPEVDILGVAGGGWWQGFTQNGGESGRYKNWVLVPPLTGPTGFKTTGYTKYKFERDQFVITKVNKYPEISIKLADYLYSSEGGYNTAYGPEGIGWRRPTTPGAVGLNGKPAQYERLTPQEANNFNWGFVGPRYMPQSERLAETKALGNDIWLAPKLMTRLTGEVLAKYVGVQVPDDQIMPPLYLTEEQTAELKQVETGIANYIKESGVRFIIGELSLDKDWDKYLAELKNAGLDRMLQFYQAAYNAQYVKK